MSFKNFTPASERDSNAARIDAIRGLEDNFAQSLVSQWDRKGRLSEKQWPYVDKFAARVKQGPPSDPRIDALKASGASGDFPESLIRQFEQRGHLSDKQWHWVEKLAKPEPKRDNFINVVRILQSRAHTYKLPALYFNLYGLELKLKVLGEYSRTPGDVSVKVNGNWIGRIRKDGESFLREPGDVLVDFLKSLTEENLFDVVTSQGKDEAWGRCCCCGAKLENPESVKRGIGPICAQKWFGG